MQAVTRGALLSCLALASLASAADAFPVRSVRIVVPFPAGGPSDLLARMMAPRLIEAWGQQVVIDNRPGGGTIIGTELVAKAPPDGHTVVMIYTGHATNPSLHSKLPYDTLRDFSAVTLCTMLPIVLTTHPGLPAHSLRELIVLARAKPGQLAFATSGNGSTGHLAGEMFKFATHVDLVHVPYKGSAPAISDVLGGQIPMTFDGLPAALPHVKAGKMKALAVTSTARSPLVPEVPTVAESGFPGFVADAWFGVVAPSKTPRDAIAKLSADMVKAVRTREVSEKLTDMGYLPVANTPAEFDAFIRSEISKWAKVVQQANMQID